ncbi:MAG: hypothetical protein ACK417_11805 [Bacteroidia bacterium]
MEQFNNNYFFHKDLIIKSLQSQSYQIEYFLPVQMVKRIMSYEPFPSKKRFICILRILEFITMIFEKGYSNNKYTAIPIHSRMWEQYFTSQLASLYKKMLLATGIVIITGNKLSNKVYQPGLHSTHYLLGHHWHNAECSRICVDIGRNKLSFIKKTIETFADENEDDELNEVKIDVDAHFEVKNIHLLKEEALSAEKEYHKKNGTSQKKYNHRVRSILSFETKTNENKQGKKGHRLYHKASNLSRISRNYLINKSNRKPYRCSDVKNCQPLLSVAVLKENNLPFDDDYQLLCEKGLFYEEFVSDKRTRDQAKTALYKSIFFSQKPKRKIFQEFQMRFPVTHQSLMTLCANKDLSLAAKLQRMESSIFNGIPGRNGARDNFFTLHDAVYFSEKYDTLYFENQIKQGFKQYSITPSIDLS